MSWRAALVSRKDGTYHPMGTMSKIRVALLAGGRHLSAGGRNLSSEEQYVKAKGGIYKLGGGTYQPEGGTCHSNGGMSKIRVVPISWRAATII